MSKAKPHTIKMSALQCLVCGDIVYSRANHDCHFCTCGAVMVDAGPGYGRAAGDMKKMKSVMIKVEATIEELWEDWAERIDKFGIIKGKNALQRLKERYGKKKKTKF
jgi:hypothetical protein